MLLVETFDVLGQFHVTLKLKANIYNIATFYT